ncbi:hypothetical protein SAMD00019534_061930 [Acytostelium subglobosum LB1]|uniref:hypothetical protein n=1 Tax=Acytostelium subglobosum LB1 TaxID=1410327 RepID=UPI0006451206|nr:hypothetical protein SAMD00019534_061930 [Acytostelium subglobosum LB1]GAM23018.1 hypothetical protein SAMD00019534_061930 [Acytostelium subglobosum LB1]|eukprot:XP_012754245.1 hypothetical protein SAMD00019534_061930 [Acytostelium subglobosum LB1]
MDKFKVCPDEKFIAQYANNDEIIKRLKYTPNMSSKSAAIKLIGQAASTGNLHFLRHFHNNFKQTIDRMDDRHHQKYPNRTSDVEDILNDVLKKGMMEVFIYILDEMGWVLEPGAKVSVDYLPMDQPLDNLATFQSYSSCQQTNWNSTIPLTKWPYRQWRCTKNHMDNEEMSWTM